MKGIIGGLRWVWEWFVSRYFPKKYMVIIHPPILGKILTTCRTRWGAKMIAKQINESKTGNGTLWEAHVRSAEDEDDELYRDLTGQPLIEDSSDRWIS